MNIHQLSVTYAVDPDRILVQVNTLAGEVLRLWLTRRLTLKLLPLLTREATKVEVNSAQLAVQDDTAKKMLMEFKKQASLQQGDFKTPFKSDATVFPLGAEPLLVTSMSLTPTGKGALRIGFEEKPAGAVNARGFQVTMESSLLQSFMHLLESAIKLSEWGVLPTQNQEASAEDAGDKAQVSNPVRYLN